MGSTFIQLLNRQSTILVDVIDEIPQRQVLERFVILFVAEETAKAIKQFSSGKAPGEDGIPPEMYKYVDDTLVTALTRLFQQLWVEEAVPQDFKEATLIHLYPFSM